MCLINGKREADISLQQEKSMRPFGKNNSELVVGTRHVRNSEEANKKSLLMGLYKDTESIIYHYKDLFDRIVHGEIKEIYTLVFLFRI